MVTATLGVTPASADPDGAPPGVDKGTARPGPFHGAGASSDVMALMQAQAALGRVAERVRGVATETPESGLGGIAVEPENATLRIYWHGTVPSDVSREVQAARRAGMTVIVASAPYTEAQLQAEIARLAAIHMRGDTATGARVASLGPKPDGTGLFVEVSGLKPGLSGADAAAEARRLIPSLHSSVPLDVSNASPVFADRWFDSPPYWGGAYVERWINGAPRNACSTGFGVTGNNGAATYIMFANHCGAGEWRTGRVTLPDGTIAQRTLGNTIAANDFQHDSQLILTSAANAVYVGDSFIGPNQTYRVMKQAARNSSGEYVCTSGSYSGTVCNIKITGTGMTINIIGYGQVTGMVRADHQQMLGAAGNGDSGGPVITTLGSDTYARGTISAMDRDRFVVCQGVNEAGRNCSWRIYYPDILLQLSGLGVRLNTG
jgi:streptogrisin D